MKVDFIVPLYGYFARFVNKEALLKSYVQTSSTKHPGYEEIKAEVLSSDDSRVIDCIGDYIFSINEKYLSDRIKNSKGFVLFVEYGTINLEYDKQRGTRQDLSIIVAHELSMTNNDSIQELSLMSGCLDVLQTIIEAMITDQEDLNFCGDESLILDQVEIMPVDPTRFYGRGGWCAQFKNAKTIMK